MTPGQRAYEASSFVRLRNAVRQAGDIDDASTQAMVDICRARDATLARLGESTPAPDPGQMRRAHDRRRSSQARRSAGARRPAPSPVAAGDLVDLPWTAAHAAQLAAAVRDAADAVAYDREFGSPYHPEYL